MRRSGHIMIDRAQGGQAIRKALKMARRGFLNGGFRRGHALQRQPGASVQRRRGVARDRDAAKMRADGDQRNRQFLSARRANRAPGRQMRMAIGPPIDTAELRGADRESLTRQLEAERARAFPHRSLSRKDSPRRHGTAAQFGRVARDGRKTFQVLRSKMNSGTWLAIFGSSASTRRPHRSSAPGDR